MWPALARQTNNAHPATSAAPARAIAAPYQAIGSAATGLATRRDTVCRKPSSGVVRPQKKPRWIESASHRAPSSAQIEFSGCEGHIRASSIATIPPAAPAPSRACLAVIFGGAGALGNKCPSTHSRADHNAGPAVLARMGGGLPGISRF